VEVDAGLAEQLVAVETFGRGLAMLAVHQLADVAERELGGPLTCYHLAQAEHNKTHRQNQ
jgi:hypothetical protein